MHSFAAAILSLFVLGISTTTAQTVIPGVMSQCSKPGQFALTFDDGPSAFTPQLLKLLDDERVPVTFFVLGAQVAQPELQPAIKDAYARGHQIGSHTYSHPNLTLLTVDEVRDQMVRTDQLLRQVIGASPYYMRPPFGEVSTSSLEVLKGELDYVVVQWNLDSNDWRVKDLPHQFSQVAKAFTRLLGQSTVSPTTSNFISLQHDTLDFSVEQTRRIIRDIRAKNYQFVTVAECLGSPKPQYRNAPDGVFGQGAGTAVQPKPNPEANPLIRSQTTQQKNGTGATSAAPSATTPTPLYWMTASAMTLMTTALFQLL